MAGFFPDSHYNNRINVLFILLDLILWKTLANTYTFVPLHFYFKPASEVII